MKKFLPFLAIFFLTLFFQSCQQQQKKPAEQQKEIVKYEQYISAFTVGQISSLAPVQVVFTQDIKYHEPNTLLDKDLFRLEPGVDGELYLSNPHTLEFRPDEPLESGKEYLATLALDKLLKTATGLDDFTFNFSVIRQDFTVQPGRCLSIGAADAYLKKYEGKIQTADVMPLEQVEKLLIASSPFEKLRVKVSQSGNNEFTYTIDSIQRKDDPYIVKLTWDWSSVGRDKKGSREFEVPAIGDFKLLDVFVDHGADQFIQLSFSDPIDKSQDLTGLIRLEDIDNLRISVSGSSVQLYPPNRLTGEHLLVVEEAVKNTRGKTLGVTEESRIMLEALKPQVEILGNGSIIPGPDGLSLPFRAVGLRAVDITVYKIFADNVPQFFQYNNYSGSNNIKFVGRPVYRKFHRLDDVVGIDTKKWNAFTIDLSEMALEDMGAIYRVRISFRNEYADYPCGEESTPDLSEFEEQALMSKRELQYFDGDNNYYYEWPEGYSWYDKDNPCTNSYYNRNRFPERNLLWSRLGVIAKSADSKMFTVAVTDLLDAKAVYGATVEFYNYQKQFLSSGTTNSEGMMYIKLDEKPYLLKASYDDNQSWMRLDDGMSLSVSNFDVSGQEVQDGIKGMIYGERGVWRPGDTLFLTFVMDDLNQKLPADHPAVLELFDARGRQAGRKVNHDGVDGFYRFTMTTDADAPTGNWSAVVRVGGASFNKRIKIETVKPNRLKIALDFNRTPLQAKDNSQVGTIEAKWLHGADASNLKAKVKVTLAGSVTKFEGFNQYTFDDPSKKYWPSEKTVFDGRLNKDGRATFDLNLWVNDNAPGMLKANFSTRVFEEGGDFSTDYYSVPLSPFKRYVGVFVPGGGDYKNKLQTDTGNIIRIASVDEKGNPVSMKKVEVKVYRVGWRWWWSSSDDNLAQWMRGQYADIVMQKTIDTENGKGMVKLKIDYPNWGRYLIHVSDPEGGHSAGTTVYVDWPYYRNRNKRANPAGATMLTFSADKEVYNPGDQVTISFPSAEGSKALISFESGDKVLKTSWIDCETEETHYDFEVTPDMAPNIFISLTLLQPHAQTVNDLPIRMYGIISIKVEDPETILYPQLKLPDEIKPKSKYTVSVSEKFGHPMTYTIAVVDEGLLDLTRFKTPDPWSTFFARVALGVKTWDLFDDVLGAFGAEIQKVLAIGGDEEAAKENDKKANRFKPVVSYLGPFTLPAGETQTHELLMPNYVGSVRAMVVAGKNGAWGSTEATCPVRQAVMVLPTAPRVIGSGETMDLPVSVFAMKENVEQVKISVEVEGELIIPGEENLELKFEKPGEQMVYFKLKAKEAVGKGKIIVKAVSGNEQASAEIELEVRNPNPVITKSETFELNTSKNEIYGFEFHGIDGTNSGNFEVSILPSFNLEKNLKYLIRYPYGCVEQVTSSVFPQLYLDQLVELDEKQKNRISTNITKAIQRLKRFQNSSGSLSYWPGRSYYSSWGTSYAGHFMLLAEQQGYVIPYDFKKRWLESQSDLAEEYYNEYKGRYGRYGDLQQAYRLYTLALAGQPNIGAMNRLREHDNLSVAAKWRLAAAYALAGKPEVANKIVKYNEISNLENYKSPGSTYGSRLRDQAMILETLVLLNRMNEAYDLLLIMIEQMKTGYLSTQTGAFCLYSIAKFAAESEASSNLEFRYKYGSQSETIVSAMRSYSIDLDTEDKSPKSIEISNQSEGSLYITKTITGQPLAGQEESEHNNLEIEVDYLTLGGAPLAIDSLAQGTDFMVEVSIINPGYMGKYENMALSQVFPSGWEILNTRIGDQQSSSNEDPFDYRDIRDDRVYTFFSIDPSKQVSYRVMLNAAYTGKFYLPAVSCEAMYNDKIFAREKGRWVKVVK